MSTWRGIKKNKFNAKKVTTRDGLVFDSKREYSRWLDLVILQQAGKITGLDRQIPYKLSINGVHICKYISDFTYFENGKKVVEDSKGYRTDVYKLKAKMMLAIHDIEILET